MKRPNLPTTNNPHSLILCPVMWKLDQPTIEAEAVEEEEAGAGATEEEVTTEKLLSGISKSLKISTRL